MRREAKGKRVKQTLDVLIILCGAGAVFLVFKEIGTWRFAPAVYFVIVIGMAAAIYDLFRLSGSKNTEEIMPEAERIQGIQRLILLDEEGKPIKSWDLQGKISLIIGKAGRDQELDIDLSDCEYSSFIDFQHAVLNFCLDQWYVEDLGSQNGVKVGKVEDGECYRVIHRPCKVVAGDVLYIANAYEPGLFFQEVVLIHKESSRQYRYVHTLMDQLDAVGSQTEYYPNGTVKRLVLDSGKIGQHNLFLLKGNQRKDPIVSLPLAESLLRRRPMGIHFEEVEVQ